MNKLLSEKVVIEAPISFSGSAKRIFKMVNWADNIDNGVIQTIFRIFLWCIAVNLTLYAWIFVIIWYFIIFGLFGIFVIPFRLFTRSGRRAKKQALQHREIMDALRENK